MRLTSRDPISAAAQQQQRPASSGLREAGATPTMPTNSAGSAGSRPPLHLSDRDNRTVAELPPGAAAASPAVSGRTRSSASNGGGGGGDANNNNAADIDSRRSIDFGVVVHGGAFASALHAVGGASSAMMNAPGFATGAAAGSGLAARRGKRKQPDPGRRDGSAAPTAPLSSNRRRPRSASPAPSGGGGGAGTGTAQQQAQQQPTTSAAAREAVGAGGTLLHYFAAMDGASRGSYGTGGMNTNTAAATEKGGGERGNNEASLPPSSKAAKTAHPHPHRPPSASQVATAAAAAKAAAAADSDIDAWAERETELTGAAARAEAAADAARGAERAAHTQAAQLRPPIPGLAAVGEPHFGPHCTPSSRRAHRAAGPAGPRTIRCPPPQSFPRRCACRPGRAPGSSPLDAACGSRRSGTAQRGWRACWRRP